MKNLNRIALAGLLVSLVTTTTFAGDFKGNGGRWTEINGKKYLLDLALKKVHDPLSSRPPYFNPKIKPSAELITRVESALVNLDNAPSTLIAQKIAEITNLRPGFSFVILATMESINWNPIPWSLNLVLDTDVDTQMQVTSEQAAARFMNSVYINDQVWMDFDPENRAALIVHEVLYAMTAPKARLRHYTKTVNGVTTMSAVEYPEQASETATRVTGALFSREFEKRGAATLSQEDFGTNFENVPGINVRKKGANDNSSVFLIEGQQNISVQKQHYFFTEYGSTWAKMRWIKLDYVQVALGKVPSAVLSEAENKLCLDVSSRDFRILSEASSRIENVIKWESYATYSGDPANADPVQTKSVKTVLATIPNGISEIFEEYPVQADCKKAVAAFLGKLTADFQSSHEILPLK